MQTLVDSRTCSVEEAAAELGIGRSLAYELARSGRFPVRVLRIGRLYRIPTAALRRLLEEGALETKDGRADGR